MRKRKTAKVQGIVQHARDALMGDPTGTFDEGFDDEDAEDRVQYNAWGTCCMFNINIIITQYAVIS